MTRETSGNTGSGWSITRFIVALTGLITAVAAFITVVWPMLINGPTPPPTVGDVSTNTRHPEQTPTPTATKIPPTATVTIPPPSRASLRGEILRLQAATIAALKEGDIPEAERLLKETEAQIDEALRRWPDDTEFMLLRGYHYKNLAMEYQQLEMESEMDDYLSKAEKTFKLILRIDEEDAGAWNGLGSVYLLRCEIDLAEVAIRKALEINPDYQAAKNDLGKIEAFRAWCNR